MYLVRMATHSSILAWRIPEMEEPGRLQFMGSQRVGHDWATSFYFFKLVKVKVKSLSPETLYNPVGCVHGIFQAKVLEWVAISFSSGSSWPRDRARASLTVGRSFTVWATYRNWWIDSYSLVRKCKLIQRGKRESGKGEGEYL